MTGNGSSLLLLNVYKNLHNEGYKVVIFSNQGGVEKGKVRIQDVTGKINDMAKSAGVPLCGLLATADDKFVFFSSCLIILSPNNLFFVK